MTQPRFHPWIHRTAVATTVVALLPIVVGALVTTMKAGMAFADWPSSDGHFMLTYPWLGDFVHGAKDKFVEHGHRLAGMLIGVTCILLAAVIWRSEPRRWVRWLAVTVLLCVILQGLLGGARVLADDPRMAMVHGNFAAIVFCLMATVALVTSRGWLERDHQKTMANASADDSHMIKPLAFLTTLAIYGQSLLGGRQRHLHDLLHEHLGGAIIASLFAIATIVAVHRTRNAWLRRPAYGMLLALLAQLVLGAGSWVTKFGFASIGYVAKQGATSQLIIRSGHTVVGMLLLMSSVVLLLRVLRESRSGSRLHEKLTETTSSLLPSRLTTEGGAQ